jgi:hypothetical protein
MLVPAPAKTPDNGNPTVAYFPAWTGRHRAPLFHRAGVSIATRVNDQRIAARSFRWLAESGVDCVAL